MRRSDAQYRILFVPVSGPKGLGEYMRSLYLAEAAQLRWPGADIRFIVSRQAPYAGDVPFRTHLTDSSPTKHVREVNRIVDGFRPDVTVFDCSGRASQMKHARSAGSRIIFLSQHERKRRRGFKLTRMRSTDLHWIVQPKFVDGDLSRLERLKLRIVGRPKVTFIGPVFSPPRPPGQSLPADPYFFCCAGGGGNRVNGRNSAELFREAAAEVSRKSGMPGVMVMGPNYRGEPGSQHGLIILPQLDGAELAHVLAGSEFAMLGGGGLLGQAVALGVPCVAVPVAKDQPPRVSAYRREGLCVAAEPDTLVQVTLDDLSPDERNRLRTCMKEAGLRNGLVAAIDQLSEMLKSRAGPG